MLNLLRRVFDEQSTDLRRPILGIYILLIAANIAAWVWAFSLFRNQPLLLGTALLAYGFGLRHAVDADHIAAIDNVTRKLMQQGKRSVSIGFYFALGHSSVVGAKVRNANGDTVGKIEDLYVDTHGSIKTLVVSVGGFLGVGAKDVAVNWNDIKYSRDGKSVVLTTGLSKDALMALPDYKYERRRPAEQAVAPK